MTSYIIAASGRGIGRRGGGGSLKHVIWWLRDYAGELYVPSGRAVLDYVIDHDDVPLTNVVDNLQFVPAAAAFEEQIRKGADAHTLAKAHLKLEQAGRWLVVVNRSTLNLLSVAMNCTEADVYVAASARGTVIKVRRRITALSLTTIVGELSNRIGGEWAHPYHDMALRKGRADDSVLEAVLEEIGRH